MQTVDPQRRPMAPVLLISMPFGPLAQPSIGLSLLKAAVRRHQIDADILYLTLPFAELIGPSLYMQIANGIPSVVDLVGEWLFSRALFGTGDDAYIDEVLYGRMAAHAKGWLGAPKQVTESFVAEILRAREQVEAFLDACVLQVVDRRPAIVGLTSTFQQHVSSLALAKRIKHALPEVFVVLGGANCEAAMGAETIRQFCFVDAVVSGEGDVVFPRLVQRVLCGDPVDNLPGVYTRRGAGLITHHNAPPITAMDDLPYPDFDDFFAQYSKTRLGEHVLPRLLFETSRGCWWGQKKHCTFCGLNGAIMAYRSKSAVRALDELAYLTERHPGLPVWVVDNILDMTYFRDFIPRLTERHLDVNLFYEVKANLSKGQLRALRDAGISKIQPGIESLSSPVLALMGKGVKALQNIQLLKWCKELGITAYWNVLWGFPGEPPEEYARLARLIPLLTHLAPPHGADRIRLDRFSPNFDGAEERGFTQVEPYPTYYHIYPLTAESVQNLAYYFTFAYDQPQDVAAYTQAVAEAIVEWKEWHDRSDLFHVDKGTHLLIWDLRPASVRPLTILRGLRRLAYLACDSIQSLMQLQHTIQDPTEAERVLSSSCVERMLAPLVERGLMIREGNSYLSLAAALGPYSPNRAVLERFHEVLKNLGPVSDNRVVVSMAQLIEEDEDYGRN